MEGVSGRLAVFFDDPFWVGVFERESAGQLEVCRVVFGVEPRDAELCQFLLTDWRRLQFSAAVESGVPDERHLNPKRLQKLARKEMQTDGIGTKAQQALKLQMEAGKKQRREQNRQRTDEMEERLRQLKQHKKKEKHKGH